MTKDKDSKFITVTKDFLAYALYGLFTNAYVEGAKADKETTTLGEHDKLCRKHCDETIKYLQNVSVRFKE